MHHKGESSVAALILGYSMAAVLVLAVAAAFVLAWLRPAWVLAALVLATIPIIIAFSVRLPEEAIAEWIRARVSMAWAWVIQRPLSRARVVVLIAGLAMPVVSAARLYSEVRAERAEEEHRRAEEEYRKVQAEEREQLERKCAADQTFAALLSDGPDLSQTDMAALRAAASCGPMSDKLRAGLVSLWTARTVRFVAADQEKNDDDPSDLKLASEALAYAVELGGASVELMDAAGAIQLSLLTKFVRMARAAETGKRFLEAEQLYNACSESATDRLPPKRLSELRMTPAECTAAKSYVQALGALGAEPDTDSYRRAAEFIGPAVDAKYKDSRRLQARWTTRADRAEKERERAWNRRRRRAESRCTPQHRECPAATIQETLVLGDWSQVFEAREEAERVVRRARRESKTVREHLGQRLEQLEEREKELRDRLDETKELKSYHCRELERCIDAAMREAE